jgi:hypothetical protein
VAFYLDYLNKQPAASDRTETWSRIQSLQEAMRRAAAD